MNDEKTEMQLHNKAAAYKEEKNTQASHTLVGMK